MELIRAQRFVAMQVDVIHANLGSNNIVIQMNVLTLHHYLGKSLEDTFALHSIYCIKGAILTLENSNICHVSE
jgi:hypothetical protein